MIYATRAIGLRYIQMDVQREQTGKKVGSVNLLSELIRFVCYDWIFLIYIFVWLTSLAYDIVCIVFGSLEPECIAGTSNLISGIYHLVLRSLLFWFFVCVSCQVSCSENACCSPLIALLTCGMIDKEKQRPVRERLAAKLQAKGATGGGMQQQPAA